jgi:hypothetical protein
LYKSGDTQVNYINGKDLKWLSFYLD